MASNFSPRVTINDLDFITAWVDVDDAICIEQPFNPESGTGAVWESEEQALDWATRHAAVLNEQPAPVDRMTVLEAKLDALLAALPN
jgi:hypothetical protein